MAFRDAIALDPQDAESHRGLGEALFHLQRWRQAADAFRSAIERRPDTAQSHHRLGDALSRLELWEKAADAYLRALQLNPALSEAYQGLGLALDRLDRAKDSVEAYQLAVDLAVASDVCAEIGQILESRGAIEAAITAYAKAIALNPRCANACERLGRVLRHAGRIDDAAFVEQQSLRLGAGEAPSAVTPIETMLRIASASNDLLIAADGHTYIDVFCGAGSVLMGHVNPAITAALQTQLNQVWITGVAPTNIRAEAQAVVESFFPSSHYLAALYSTGMEAAEFALRFARVATRRRRVVGFEQCMHGKSMATAYLGWPNDDVRLPDFYRVPYIPHWSEDRILDRVFELVSTDTIAAVFIEPLQGSAGGHLASASFFQELDRLCAAHGTLMVFDEIFSGFYRTGDAFLHQTLGVTPDLVLIGKAMGNGFPVSGVMADRQYRVERSMLPGSTFAGSPLAAAAVVATLRQMQSRSMSADVARIGEVISTGLKDVGRAGVTMRGRGACWILEFPDALRVNDAAGRISRSGVVVSIVGSYIRVLPPATITPDHLDRACRVIRDACLASAGLHAT